MPRQTSANSEKLASASNGRRDFNKIDGAFLEKLRDFLPESRISTSAEDLDLYSRDWTEDLSFSPEVVVKPETTEEISRLLRLCNESRVPVTPAGGRTGLSGGMLPVYGGVLLSLERMNKILDVDTRNLQMTVQPGVITQVIHETAEAEGLMYPPDPASKGSCLIGGNVAENAGGARAVKYGVTQHFVLSLEVVLADGEIVRAGAKTLKNATGYNLTQLMVGSEGTLGVVTEITLRLVPKPAEEATMLIPFADAGNACDAVSAIFRAGITPSAVEFIEKDALDFGQEYLGINQYETKGIEAHLLINIDGNDMEEIMPSCEKVAEIAESFGGGEVYFAETKDKQDELWRIRRCLGEAVKSRTIYKEEDTVVPRAELAKLLRFIKATGKEYGFRSVCYGHAGDGNLHVNIIKADMSDAKWNDELPRAIEKIFRYTKELGGTISGEHGVGYVQRQYMPVAFSERELQIMKQIKQVFDPNGILNPGKLFP